MNQFRIIFALLISLVLLACEPSEQASDSPVVGQAAKRDGESAQQLGVDYRSVDLAEVHTSESMQAACDTEVAALNLGLQGLAQFEGEPGIDDFLESINAWQISHSNMTNTAHLLAVVHPEETLREAADNCEQSLAQVVSDFNLSRPIYDRVARVDISSADADTQRSVERMLLSFRLAGVSQDEATRERIKELNQEITVVGQEFDKNIRDSVLYLELNSPDMLAGLPQDYIDGHQPNEDGVIRISTRYPDLFPFMTYAEDHDLRRQMSVLSSTRAYPENKAVLEKLLSLRYELAGLLGFDNYAELITVDKMSGTPQRVKGFLQELTEYTQAAQDREYELLLAELRKEQPDAERVESWQFGYLKEKVVTDRFNVDSKEVRQYFNYNGSREGILQLVQDLFNVRFKPWETETWHEDVEPYELWDGDQLIGRFYLDMHPRDGKFQHAAVFPMRNGITGEQTPLASLLCNFPRDDELMQHSQVVTFLHEFGHLIHYLFAGQHHWANVSGIATEWDFVEAPSQMLQEWVWDYDTISQFAKNADGEVISRSLLQRMIAARDFGLGINTRAQLSYAATSMGLYDRNPEGLDIKSFVDNIYRQYRPFQPLEESHFYASFGHLNGYSAIYYTYQWSLAIATDMFTRFEEEGLRNVETAGEYRDQVLGQGGAKPAAELVSDFLGREISFKPYADRLNRAGFVGREPVKQVVH